MAFFMLIAAIFAALQGKFIVISIKSVAAIFKHLASTKYPRDTFSRIGLVWLILTDGSSLYCLFFLCANYRLRNACPAGIAHTYMAAEYLEKAGANSA